MYDKLWWLGVSVGHLARPVACDLVTAAGAAVSATSSVGREDDGVDAGAQLQQGRWTDVCVMPPGSRMGAIGVTAVYGSE